jgi:hypothetical protein
MSSIESDPLKLAETLLMLMRDVHQPQYDTTAIETYRDFAVMYAPALARALISRDGLNVQVGSKSTRKLKLENVQLRKTVDQLTEALRIARENAIKRTL